MNLSKLQTRLLELSDSLEGRNLAGSQAGMSVSIYSGVDTREKLAAWARFLGDGTSVISGNEHVWLKKYADGIEFSVFFTPGLLGGKVVEVCQDDQAGLDALMAEHREQVPA